MHKENNSRLAVVVVKFPRHASAIVYLEKFLKEKKISYLIKQPYTMRSIHKLNSTRWSEYSHGQCLLMGNICYHYVQRYKGHDMETIPV